MTHPGPQPSHVSLTPLVDCLFLDDPKKNKLQFYAPGASGWFGTVTFSPSLCSSLPVTVSEMRRKDIYMTYVLVNAGKWRYLSGVKSPSSPGENAFVGELGPLIIALLSAWAHVSQRPSGELSH